MTLSLIVARARNGVIGQNGELPWRLKDDLAFFKATTLGKPVIMGRKTWASIGKALPGRTNIVVSRDTHFQTPGGLLFPGLEAALQAGAAIARTGPESGDEVFVIGGGELYAQTLPVADRLYVTEVEAEPVGDAVFPLFEEQGWDERSSRSFPADERNAFAFTIRVLDRVPT